jgi:hypothetical protein
MLEFGEAKSLNGEYDFSGLLRYEVEALVPLIIESLS